MSKEDKKRTPLKLDEINLLEMILRAPFLLINLVQLLANNGKFGFEDEETGDLFINPFAFYRLFIDDETDTLE